MNLDFLDKEEHKDIPLYKILLDGKENLPVFLCKYSTVKLPSKIHRHEYLQINYIRKGKMKHVINNNAFDVINGDIFIIPPFVPHYLIDSEDDNGEVYEFEFMPEFINSNFQEIDHVKSFFDFAYIEPFLVCENQVNPRLNLCGKERIEIETILNEALDEYTEKNPGYGLIIKSLLLKLLVIVGREFSENLNETGDSGIYSRHREAILQVVQYVNDNYHKQITIEEASKISLFSQSYFSYLFKSITSKTFVEYLNDIRLSPAMALLRDTKKMVIEVSNEVGFNNVNHFNKLFRQKVGLTPLTYRKRRGNL